VIRVMEMSALDKNISLLTIRAEGLTPEIISGLEQWGEDIRLDDGNLTMTIRSESDLPQINRYLVEHDVQVYALTPNRVSLEEIFIETLGKDSGL
jgi:hypothetical protein